MSSARDAILNALKDLSDEDFPEFYYKLTDPVREDEEPCIRLSEVEGKPRATVRNVLVKRFGPEALDVTVRTLEAIGCRDEAQRLQRQKEKLAAGASGGPVTRSTSSMVSLDPAPQGDPQELLKSIRPKFVQNVSNSILDQLLDHLLLTEVLTQLEMEYLQEQRRDDKARKMIDAVVKKGPGPSSTLIKQYCKLDPQNELCEKLKHSN